MASVLESADLIDSGGQTAFNRSVWEKVLMDPLYTQLPGRVETDRYGQIIMSPPPAPEHGESQAGIVELFRKLLPEGHVITECPVSTRDGVKLVDVGWISRPRRRAQAGVACFAQAPEICVEVISPGNTRRELRDKKALYFEAGAEEVWFCHGDGRMEFFRKEAPEPTTSSGLCPGFPSRFSIE